MRELRKAFVFCFNGLRFDDIVRKNLEYAGFNTIMYYENVGQHAINHEIEKIRISDNLNVNFVIIYSGHLDKKSALFRDEMRKRGIVFLQIKKGYFGHHSYK